MNQQIDCPSATAEAPVRVASLPFSSIPGQSKLFLDYLSDPVSLREFYPNVARSHVDLVDFIPTVLGAYSVDRDALCDALAAQHSARVGGQKALDNIELLRKENTVAVLTGQQAGLFTGPLYTVYKALSAVRMAECLHSRGHDAVPVFWAATEDHDFDEVSHAVVADSESNLSRISYQPDSYVEKEPVGRVSIATDVEECIVALLAVLPETEFTPVLARMLRSSYAAGETFGTAFASLIARMFEPFGLIVLDPLDPAIKRLAAPIYAQAVMHSTELVASIIERGKKLIEAGYHTQVEAGADYFPLFWHDDDGRRRTLRRADDGSVHVSGTKTQFPIDALGRIAAEQPERFSPGVMLRPVVQDYLFPTLCYFGGGAEIAYFAQNSEAYRVLGRPATPIRHRQSFTVVEARYERSMDKLGLEFTDLFRDADDLTSEIIATLIDPQTVRLFADVEEKINSQLRRLDEALSAFDGTLAAGFANRRRKIIYHIAATRSRYERERLRKDEVAERRLRSLFTELVPNGHLQERTLNITQFLDRYGPYFIDWVYQSIDLSDDRHRIIHL